MACVSDERDGGFQGTGKGPKIAILGKDQTYFKGITTISGHTSYALIRQGEASIRCIFFVEHRVSWIRRSRSDISGAVELSG